MASTNHTANYNLPQWVASDPFSRTEFNTAFAAVDAAIKSAADAAAAAGNCNICLGSWVGTGSNSRTVTLPQTPKLMLLFGEYEGQALVGFVTQDAARRIADGSTFDMHDYFSLSGKTVTIRNVMFFNSNAKTVHYVIFY